MGAYTVPFLAVYAGPELATAVLGAFGVGAFLSRWLGAWMALHLSPRTVVSTGLAATGVALILLLSVRGSLTMVGAAALVGLAFEIYEPVTYEAFAQAVTASERRRAYTLLSTVLVAAGALSGLVVTVLLPLGTNWLILADSATCFAAAAVAWRHLSADRPLPRAERQKSRWKPPSSLVLLTAAGTIFSIGYLAVVMFVPLALFDRGAAAWVPGVILMVSAVAAPLLSATRSRAAGNRHRPRELEFGLTFTALLGVALTTLHDVVWFSALYVLWTAASASLLGEWSARVADHAPAPDRTLWFAFHGSSWAVAQPAVPACVALLAPVVPDASDAALLVAPAALALSAILLLFTATPGVRGGTASDLAGRPDEQPRRG
ncbi:MFS transporter [Streptomyces sp. NPDC058155]|uniref:MFS transporter n=1 Tax=Streptomyces sp. NPDC058155 TaxID=3346359 RepID=UPI0036E7ECCC